MIIFDKFKDGKSKIVTMSYDDGTIHDRRLVEIFNKYGIKGTFHLNSGFLGHDGRLTADELKTLFAGHEVSLHMLTHPFPTKLPDESIVYQIMEDRKNLEAACGYIVKGMSYPYGDVSDEVVEKLKNLGVVYSRTTHVTHGFGFPTDFMHWNGTCHHHDALADAKRFIELINRNDHHQLLYIWGHSYEFDRENNWEDIEEVCKMLGGRDEIWYATNIEIYNYMTAVRRLEISADMKMVHNPSAIPVWINWDNETVKIDAGETVCK